MKSLKLTTSLMLLTLVSAAAIQGQADSGFRITEIMPSDKVVPGQILELHVEGFGGAPNPEDFQIEVTQDGVKQEMNAREASSMMTSRGNQEGPEGEMKALHRITFVVPQGLHPGEAEIAVSYQNKRSSTAKLTIVERPLKPLVASLVAMTMGPIDPRSAKPSAPTGDMGWRLERDSKAEIRIMPLTDPEDPNSGILIRFKQRDTYFDANARVVHRPRTTETQQGGVTFLPARDVLEVDIPAALEMGPAVIEIRVRANGQNSDPTILKVQITDATRSAEAPKENSPRLLLAMPEKIGAGQTLMLSVDYMRTLNPDPSQTMVLIEHDGARYVVKPDFNSAERSPNWTPDSPVVLMVRPTRQLIGAVQVHVFNSLRGEQGGLSAGKSIEVVDEPLPPEVSSVSESTADELAPLRQMYEIQQKAGRRFPEYDPSFRYVTIRGTGFDFNPNMIRIIMEQKGRRATLTYADFSLQAGIFQIVRVPAGIGAGAVAISFENRGAESFSEPVKLTFVLPPR